MKTIAALISILLLISLAGCSSKPSKKSTAKPIYSKTEKNQMTICIGLADTAFNVANKKKSGAPYESVKQYYTEQPNKRVNLETVKKVYRTKFNSAWDYTLHFFRECAINLANVPPNRHKFSSHCMQNQLVAGVSYAFKASGKPIDDAYNYFSKYNSKTVNSIIEKAYASDESRTKIKLNTWNACMDKISG